MNNASLYSQYNDLQKSDAKFALDSFFQTITFQNEDNILDVGSGDGAVTLELLLPRLKRFKKLVGVDVSEKMLQFARNRSQTSPKVDFVCLDIASDRIPQEFAQRFDHIFSFYCLNWICEERQPQALKNLFDMLRPGGDALLTAAVHNAVYNLHERMGQSEKWKSDLTNFKQYISPYYFWADADNKLRQLLENTGFVVRACKIVERSFIFPNMDNFSNWIASVNPYFQTLPDNKRHKYIYDYLEEIKKSELITTEVSTDGTGEEKILYNYTMVVAGISKL